MPRVRTNPLRPIDVAQTLVFATTDIGANNALGNVKSVTLGGTPGLSSMLFPPLQVWLNITNAVNPAAGEFFQVGPTPHFSDGTTSSTTSYGTLFPVGWNSVASAATPSSFFELPLSGYVASIFFKNGAFLTSCDWQISSSTAGTAVSITLYWVGKGL